MVNEDGFLSTILENPDDEAPRLIYADWLEKRGDPRGEFICIQCASVVSCMKVTGYQDGRLMTSQLTAQRPAFPRFVAARRAAELKRGSHHLS